MAQHEETITHITFERLREQREQILTLAKKFKASECACFWLSGARHANVNQ